MIGWVLAASANAGTLGIGVGTAIDLPDPGASNAAVPRAKTFFLPGVNLVVPYRLALAPSATLRFQAQGTFAKGKDWLAWTMPGQGASNDQVTTYAGQFGLSVGPEVRLTNPADAGGLAPYLAGDLGLVLITNWHSGLTQPELFDPAFYTAEDLADPSTTSPLTRQLVPETRLGFGLRAGALWGELGYEMAYLDAHDLRHGTPAVEPHRVAYGWNAVRLVVGFEFSGPE